MTKYRIKSINNTALSSYKAFCIGDIIELEPIDDEPKEQSLEEKIIQLKIDVCRHKPLNEQEDYWTLEPCSCQNIINIVKEHFQRNPDEIDSGIVGGLMSMKQAREHFQEHPEELFDKRKER